MTKYSPIYQIQLAQLASNHHALGQMNVTLFIKLTLWFCYGILDNKRGETPIVSSGAYTYTYDGYNRRVISNDSKGTSYSFYDAKGQLLLRETQEGLTSYVFMGE